MKIKKFNHKYKPEIERWLQVYKMGRCDWATIPKNSFVAVEGNDLLAFNYFYKSDVKIMGTMGVTLGNPTVSKEQRDDALDKLTAHLLKEVEMCGIKYFFYFADKNPMVERMQKHGMALTDNGDAYILMKTFGNKKLDYFNE